MADQEFQYVKLPDGSWGKFRADATDAQIRAQVAKNFKTAPTEDFKLASEKAPENARFPSLGATGYQVADVFAKALPTVGSVAGGTLATPAGPFGAAGGAALGAMAGDRARRLAYEALFKDLPPESAREMLTSMGTEGLEGAAAEGQAQVVNRLAAPLVENLSVLKQLYNEAGEGRGVRLTPGELTGKPMLKLGESVFEHWPGGAGEMEEFRAGQTTDINRMLDEQLERISKRNLSPEEAGKEVQKAVLDAKTRLDPQVATGLEQVEATQQRNVQGLFDRQLRDLSASEIPPEELGTTIQTNMRGEEARIRETQARDLERIKTEQQQNVNSLFSGQLDALTPVAGTSEETGGAIQQNLRAQQDAAQLKLKGNVNDIQSRQASDTQKVLDQELTRLSPQQLTSEESGLQVQGVLNDLRRQSEAAINAKYDEVRKRLGMKPGGYVPKKDLEAAAEEIPEAKAKLDEADLLFRQEQARFDVPIIKKVLTTTKPEEIANIFATAGLDDLRTLKGYLPPQVQSAAARELLESMIERARDPRTGVVSTQSLANQMKTLGEDRAKIIFGPQFTTIANSVGAIDGINTAADRATERFTTQAEAPFKPELMQKVITGRPEQIAKTLSTASLDDLRALQGAIPPDMQKAAARDVLQNIIDGARDPQTGIINGKTLAKGLRDIGPDRGRLIFGDRYDSITAAAGEFNRINAAAEASEANVKARSSAFDNDLHKKILKTNKPEEIGALLQKAGLGEMRDFLSSLSPEQRQGLRRNVLQDMIDGARDPQSGVIDPKKFARGMQTLGEGRGRLIFGDQYDQVVNSGKTLNRINEVATQQRQRVEGKSTRFNADLMTKIIGTNNPELIGGYLTKAGPDELRALYGDLPPATRQAAARNTLESMIAPARDIERAGTQVGPKGPVQSTELDPATLSTQLNDSLKKLGETRGRIIFGKEYDNIVSAAKLLDRIGFSESKVMGKMHLSSLIGGIFGAVTGTVTGGLTHGAQGALEGGVLGTGAGVASAYSLGKGVAWLLTSPNFSDMTVRGLRLAAIAATRGQPLVIDELLRSSPAQYQTQPAEGGNYGPNP